MWTQLVRVVFVQATAFTSIVGLYLTLPGRERPDWHLWTLLTCCLVFAFVCILDVRQVIRAQPKRFRSLSATKNYMKQWIASAGRVVIVSRDLTWVDEEILDLMRSKSRARELEIIMESRNNTSDNLARIGCLVTVYGRDFVPRSRFTIVDFGRAGARVAIAGKAKDGEHIVREYPADDPVFALAEDFVRLAGRSKA